MYKCGFLSTGPSRRSVLQLWEPQAGVKATDTHLEIDVKEGRRQLELKVKFICNSSDGEQNSNLPSRKRN